jgi:hypothetical protein
MRPERSGAFGQQRAASAGGQALDGLMQHALVASAWYIQQQDLGSGDHGGRLRAGSGRTQARTTAAMHTATHVCAVTA